MAEEQALTDEQLVALICSTDQEQYTTLVRRYEDKLLRYVMTFLHDEDRAKDAVQNAFIKAFINLKGFNTKLKFSSWLYRIAHNEAINEMRKYKREVSLDHPDAINMHDNKEHPDNSIDRETATNMLRRFLQKIPLTYREPLVLFYLEEKSYDEISDILHIPIGTVGTRISRGKKIMKKIYDQQHR